MHNIEFTKVAYKTFEKLESSVQAQLIVTLDKAKLDPFQANCKKLKKPLEGYRIRSGSYRILCIIDSGSIVVHAIRHRKDAYRK